MLRTQTELGIFIRWISPTCQIGQISRITCGLGVEVFDNAAIATYRLNAYTLTIHGHSVRSLLEHHTHGQYFGIVRKEAIATNYRQALLAKTCGGGTVMRCLQLRVTSRGWKLRRPM